MNRSLASNLNAQRAQAVAPSSPFPLLMLNTFPHKQGVQALLGPRPARSVSMMAITGSPCSYIPGVCPSGLRSVIHRGGCARQCADAFWPLLVG